MIRNALASQQEPDGVMTVKFRDPLSAHACVLVSRSPFIYARSTKLTLRTRQKMNGRYFGGQRVEAALYNGKQHFKRSGAGDEYEGGGDEGEKKRLDDFAKWLLTEGD